MAKVSIIIPTYNVEMFLDECLESIQRQTLQDIEIICVNDGSTDHSLEIIKKYAENDPRFVIVDKENGGYGKAMNVGLDKATENISVLWNRMIMYRLRCMRIFTRLRKRTILIW